jgi:RimJ/RimL family protein N-acetyltransferase
VQDSEFVMGAFEVPDIQFWHGRVISSEAEAGAWIDQWASRWRAESDASWAICPAETHAVAGQVSLREMSLEFGEAEVTYWIVPAYRGRALATEAAAEVSHWATGFLGLHRLVIRHSVRNPASCRVAEKLGFKLEGTNRSALLHADGWHDMHLHARIWG